MVFRNTMILLAFSLALGMAAENADARSRGHPLSWMEGPNVWDETKKFQPYLENAKHPHPTQWADRDWYAEDWIAQRQSGLALVQGYYNANIIRDQDVDDGMPVLIVGPNFYHLSGYDKRRVVHTIDVVYGVTARQQGAAITLKDWHTKRAIGYFDTQGLTLQ